MCVRVRAHTLVCMCARVCTWFLIAYLPFPVATECRPRPQERQKVSFLDITETAFIKHNKNHRYHPERRIEVVSDSRLEFCEKWLDHSNQVTDTDITRYVWHSISNTVYFISMIYGGLFLYSDLLTVSRLELLMQQLIHSLPCLFWLFIYILK